LRRGKKPRNIEDSTMSIYIDGLKDGTRYRESGLVLVVKAVIRIGRLIEGLVLLTPSKIPNSQRPNPRIRLYVWLHYT
jgi:hypothetical protein